MKHWKSLVIIRFCSLVVQGESTHSLVVRAAAPPPPHRGSSIWAQPTQQRAAQSQHALGEHNLETGRERARYEHPSLKKDPHNRGFIKTGLKATDMSILHLKVGSAVFCAGGRTEHRFTGVQLSSFCRTRSSSVVVMTTSGWRTSSKGCWESFRRPSPCSIPTSLTTPSCRATPSVSSSVHGGLAGMSAPLLLCDALNMSVRPPVTSLTRGL